MSKCETCKNAIFDHIWGEWKCKRLCHTIVEPQIHEDCEFYDKNPDAKPRLTKKWVIK